MTEKLLDVFLAPRHTGAGLLMGGKDKAPFKVRTQYVKLCYNDEGRIQHYRSNNTGALVETSCLVLDFVSAIS